VVIFFPYLKKDIGSPPPPHLPPEQLQLWMLCSWAGRAAALPFFTNEHEADPQKAPKQLWGRGLTQGRQGPRQVFPGTGLTMEREVKRHGRERPG